MRYLTLIMALLLICTKSPAQKTFIAFNAYNSLGVLSGNSPVAFTAQTVNGVRFHKWFAGAGFGIDDYYITSLPLFIDVKKEFAIKKIRLFLYGDVGTHFITKDKTTQTRFSTTKTKGDLYFEAGGGIKIKVNRRGHVFFSVGNTMKKIKQTETSPDTEFPYQYKTTYELSRLSFRFGYQF